MKSILTSKRLAQFFSLTLAIVMCFSACGGNGETSSDTPSADDAVTNTSVEQTNNEQEASSKKEATNNASSKKENTGNKQTANNSSSKNQTANKSSKVEQTNTQSAGSTTWAEDYLSTMPESVKSKGVTILMWRNMHKTEKKVLDDFVKKTGCKVKVVTTTEAEYATKLISMISSNESPDVCSLNVSNFPGIVTKSMQQN